MYSNGFPGGPVVKEPAWQHRDTGSIPGPRRPHMPWSDQAKHSEQVFLNKRSRRSEKPAHHTQGQPPLATTGHN